MRNIYSTHLGLELSGVKTESCHRLCIRMFKKAVNAGHWNGSRLNELTG